MILSKCKEEPPIIELVRNYLSNLNIKETTMKIMKHLFITTKRELNNFINHLAKEPDNNWETQKKRLEDSR